MPLTMQEIIEKYNLEDESEPLILKGKKKKRFLEDLKGNQKGMMQAFDTAVRLSMEYTNYRGVHVILGIAKTAGIEDEITKNTILEELNYVKPGTQALDYEKIKKRKENGKVVDDYWDFLEDKNVLDMEKVATRHIIKINTTNNLGKFLIELTQNYWTSPKDIKERIKKRQTRE